ncbi:hypothetical protein MKK88_30760 [Methylobacterium sp. E-005]|uniref:hypothetical protein n=1 Tax=Methylobacterium sp. E-005 TaxID=2836549 RepID=UPI001FBADD2D|nr:hypothetical protein [Methylobacterium sp. E-005]MCJ2090334.1 hypothetical protein [Methylobacterium sp. E-005]
MLALNTETACRSRAYRAFKLDRAGRIASAEIVAAEDDGHARRQVRAMAERSTIELWERTRFLGRFEPAATGRN